MRSLARLRILAFSLEIGACDLWTVPFAWEERVLSEESQLVDVRGDRS